MSTITVLGLGGRSVFLTVDHFHAPGETLRADTLYAEPGGKGYNQAVAAARLGAKVNFIGAMGDDDDAKACQAFLEAEGIRPCIEKLPYHPTAYACILTDAAGENRVTVCAGAAQHLSTAFVQSCESQIAAGDCLLLNFEYPMACNLAAMETAQKHHVPVIVNPAPACPAEASFLLGASLITPNRQEAAVLFGVADDAPVDAIAQAMTQSGIRRAVVTLGAEGALVVEGGAYQMIPAIPCKAVDTTGAGDCFTAALAVQLCQGTSLTEAAAFATRASGFSVQHRHVMPALPDRKDLE